MYKHSFILLILSISSLGYSQRIETTYLDPRDSTSNLYIIVYPPKLPWSGYMFLVPGMFQKAQEVLRQSDLPKIAAEKGILTVIPTFKSGISSLGIDSLTQISFLEILAHVTNRHKLIDQPFYVGGFSIGGTCAIKYAELALKNNYSVKPAAVFAIDAPLDFERMYNVSKRELTFLDLDEELVAENKYMIKRFEQEFGGPPDRFLTAYHTASPYSFNDTTRRAINPLANLPLRLYTEPDIQFWMTLGVDYYGLNSVDLAALASDLNKMGNKKATLITTVDKGYRKPDNKRHPHSWSIAEPKDLVKWLLAHR
jgi:hypothetical protein